MKKFKKKKEKKLSLKKSKRISKKVTKKTKSKRIKDNTIIEKDIFSNSPELMDLIIPDVIHEKRDQIILGEQRYSRCFVLATYPSRSYIGWLDRIYNQIPQRIHQTSHGVLGHIP